MRHNRLAWENIARIIKTSGDKVYQEYTEEGKLKKENKEPTKLRQPKKKNR